MLRSAHRLGRVGQAGWVGTPAGGLACLARQRLGGQRLAHLGRSGDDEFAELVQSGGAGVHRAGAGQQELADGFDDAGGVLRDRGALAVEDLAGGGFGVDGIVLAAPVAGMRMRPVDLQDLDPGRLQVSGQPGAVSAGGLHADLADGAKAAHRVQQLLIAGGRGWKACDGQQPSMLVEDRGLVGVGVGVDPTDDNTRLARHP